MDRFQNTRQPDWDWWGRLWPTPGATLRQLGVREGERLAEIGCGNGYFTLPAARITDPAAVVALDLDDSLLAELTHLADQQGIDNVDPIQGDARDLGSLLSEPVDTLLIANTFHGIDEQAGFVQQAFDVLEPDGQFVVVNWHDRPAETTTVAGGPRGPPEALRMTPEDTESVVSEAVDCTVTDRTELPPHHYALRFER